MSHNIEKWWKLLSDFQDAYAKYGGAFFALYAVTFAERGLSHPTKDRWAQDGEVLGCLPLDAENGYVIVALRPGEGPSHLAEQQRQLIAQGIPIDVANAAALKSFKEIAAMAGAALPRSIRDAIPFAPTGALSWWLATMWWSNPSLQVEVQTGMKERLGYRLVWYDPFQEAIDAIERCNLVSENPSLLCDEKVTDKAASVIAETSGSTKHSAERQHDQPDDDPIEDTLSGQKLNLYCFLNRRSHSVSFDSLAALKGCWRGDSPSDDAIEKALKRLQIALNQIDGCPVALVIEVQHRRVRLDK